MGEFELLWWVVLGLYVLESFVLLKPGEAAFYEGLFGFRLAASRLVARHPFPPGEVFRAPGGGASLDLDALKLRLAQSRRAARWLRWLGFAFFLTAFALLPAAWRRREQFPRVLLGVLLAFFLLWWLSALAAFFASRRLKLGTAKSWENLVHAFLAPGFALRASAALTARALDGFHILAQARLLLPEAEFQSLARTWLLDRAYLAQTPPRLSQAWWLDEAGDARVEAWLGGLGLDRAWAGAAPRPTDASSLSYCPRCLTNFVLPQGRCEDCALDLKPFPSLPG